MIPPLLPFPAAEERDAALFAAELFDLVQQGLITIEPSDDEGAPLRFGLPQSATGHGVAAAIADIETRRI